jgi:hypothetical protein
MRANMVAPIPSDHFTHQARNAFVKISRQPLGYLSISRLLSEQIRLEVTAENRVHAVFPKTWLKVRPASFPDTRASSRWARSALIASSVLESPSRLCTNNLARSARSAGASESASSATARFVMGIGIQYIPRGAAQVKVPRASGLVGGTPRVLSMVRQMDREGFGNCTVTGSCEAVCPKEISLCLIAHFQPAAEVHREALLETGSPIPLAFRDKFVLAA